MTALGVQDTVARGHILSIAPIYSDVYQFSLDRPFSVILSLETGSRYPILAVLNEFVSNPVSMKLFNDIFFHTVHDASGGRPAHAESKIAFS